MTKEDPIKTLMNEHEIIAQAEQIIKSINQLWKQDSEEYEAILKKLLFFFREYGDKYHHHKEEIILFSEMLTNSKFTQHELINEFTDHHMQFRSYLDITERYIMDKKYEEAQKQLTEYMNELLDHIAAENDELFVMASGIFTDEELRNIYYKFEDIDNEKGIEKKDALSDSLVDIKNKLTKLSHGI